MSWQRFWSKLSNHTSLLTQINRRFIDNLKQVSCSKNDIIVSFDVISSFTNVPLKDTFEIVIDNLYITAANVKPVDKNIFGKLMQLATQGIFMFNEKLYKVDGVIIGNPIGPTLANFFLGHLEKRHWQIFIITAVCY